MKRCMLDLDGVIVDFVKGACAAHKIKDPYDDPAFRDIFYFSRVMGIGDEEFWKPQGFEFWSNLDFMPDAREILSKLIWYFGEHNICILTNDSGFPDCAAGKQAWINKNLPEFKLRCYKGAAKEFFAGTQNVLVDDHNVNVDKFRQWGGHAILLPRPWNRKYRLNTLDHLTNELMKLNQLR